MTKFRISDGEPVEDGRRGARFLVETWRVDHPEPYVGRVRATAMVDQGFVVLPLQRTVGPRGPVAPSRPTVVLTHREVIALRNFTLLRVTRTGEMNPW
jgi:hypothetical protein